MNDEKTSLERYVSILFRNRPRTEFEIRSRSLEKGFSEEIIEETVLKLKNLELINDERFAFMYIEDGYRLKLKGKRLLVAELKQLGVSAETIDKAFEKADGEYDISDILKNDFQRNGIKNPLRWSQRMTRRGFDYYNIKRVLEEYGVD